MNTYNKSYEGNTSNELFDEDSWLSGYKSLAKFLLPGIEIYSKYIMPVDFEWNFTIDDKDFQPLFNELNKYIKEQLSDGIDQWRKRRGEEIL